jgi:hypothetical protein
MYISMISLHMLQPGMAQAVPLPYGDLVSSYSPDANIVPAGGYYDFVPIARLITILS